MVVATLDTPLTPKTWKLVGDTTLVPIATDQIVSKKKESTNGGGCMATPQIAMSCISWNCRGLGSSRAIRDLKALIRSHKSDILFRMETRLLKVRFSSLKMQLGFGHGFMVERPGLGGGLIMLWRKDLEVQLHSYSLGHIDV